MSCGCICSHAALSLWLWNMWWGLVGLLVLMLVFVWSLGQCSHSCGRGTQWRKVYCKQRLATGSYRRLSDEECAGTKPDVHRICINPDCLLPRLEGGEWSKVCVVCVANQAKLWEYISYKIFSQPIWGHPWRDKYLINNISAQTMG